MRERVVSFGIGGRLSGIVARPKDPAIESTTGLIVLNAGLLHKVGPNRVAVTMSRELGALGLPTLRFDLSGQGDSGASPDDLSYDQRSRRDVHDAMNWMASALKIEKFVLIGLCSGAFNAHASAVADERIIGSVFMDGYAFSTPQFRARYYASRLSDLDDLPSRAWRAFGRMRDGAELGERSENAVIFQQDFRGQEEVTRDLQTLCARDVKMLFLFTGGVSRYFNYENQVRECFAEVDFRELLQVHFFNLADHTYTLRHDRDLLTKTVCDWAMTHFGR